jgi:hypothetical protein
MRAVLVANPEDMIPHSVGGGLREVVDPGAGKG